MKRNFESKHTERYNIYANLRQRTSHKKPSAADASPHKEPCALQEADAPAFAVLVLPMLGTPKHPSFHWCAKALLLLCFRLVVQMAPNQSFCYLV
jgi:hypothetical protein